MDIDQLLAIQSLFCLYCHVDCHFCYNLNNTSGKVEWDIVGSWHIVYDGNDLPIKVTNETQLLTNLLLFSYFDTFLTTWWLLLSSILFMLLVPSIIPKWQHLVGLILQCGKLKEHWISESFLPILYVRDNRYCDFTGNGFEFNESGLQQGCWLLCWLLCFTKKKQSHLAFKMC